MEDAVFDGVPVSALNHLFPKIDQLGDTTKVADSITQYW